MKNIRLQIDLPEATVAQLEELMRICGVATKKELFNNALTLLEWAVKEVKSGRIVASVDENEQRYRELQMPILSHAASTGSPGSAPNTRQRGFAPVVAGHR